MRADYEVEANTPRDDLGGIESMLREMGADDPGERHQENFYSSPPCRDLGERDEALGLRDSGDDLRIAYNGLKTNKNTKTREEAETEIDPAIVRILERLGFRRGVVVRRGRRTTLFREVEFSIDRDDGLRGVRGV